VDDLVTRGTSEPYRMFTSRAEHRLLLREDNADARLTPTGRELGLLDDERWDLFEAKQRAIASQLRRLQGRRFKAGQIPQEWAQRVLNGPPPGRDQSAFDLLRRPEVSHPALIELDASLALDPRLDERLPLQVSLDLEVQASYAGYIERAADEIERARRYEDLALPSDLDYSALHALSNEVRQKLAAIRPATLGQAARVPGVTPAAVSILLVHLRRHAQRVA
jgi:tRNA uridine 5-carboxymethylaminomethyl modification enzyme